MDDWAFLRLQHEDPALAEVVEAASEPLDLMAWATPVVSWVDDPKEHRVIVIRPEPPVEKPKESRREQRVAKMAADDRQLRRDAPKLLAAATPPRRKFRPQLHVPADATDVRGLLKRHGRLRVFPDRGIVVDRVGRVVSDGYAILYREDQKSGRLRF